MREQRIEERRDVGAALSVDDDLAGEEFGVYLCVGVEVIQRGGIRRLSLLPERLVGLEDFGGGLDRGDERSRRAAETAVGVLLRHKPAETLSGAGRGRYRKSKKNPRRGALEPRPQPS